ncbi:MAG: hypothetical protein ACRCVI_02685 [Mycoplasmoidaceae bacterium]
MYYIKRRKIVFSKRIDTLHNHLTINNKVNLSLIIFAYLNRQNIQGFQKRKFKKWFNKNKLEILNFYYEKDGGFFHTFYDNDQLKHKLEKLFLFDIDAVKNLLTRNQFKDDKPYEEFLKINKNFYELIDYLRIIMINNFNEYFKFLNFIIFPSRKGWKWK